MNEFFPRPANANDVRKDLIDTTTMTAESFLTMQPGVHHYYAHTKSGAVIQLNGVGHGALIT